MAEPSRRLGRGLATLLGQSPDSLTLQAGRDGVGLLQQIPTDALQPNPRQPRSSVEPTALAELTASIARQGVLQPLLVRAIGSAGQSFEIVAGERRWRAARDAGLATVPCLVQPFSDQSAAIAALVENLQREDLDPLDEAEGFRTMMQVFGLSADALAQALGKSRSHVVNTIRLLASPEPIRAALRDRRITAGHARALLGHPDPTSALATVLDRSLSVRATEALAAMADIHPTVSPEIVVDDHTASPPARVEVSANDRDPDTVAVERMLTERLGLAVRLRDHAGRGRLVIRYTTADQLDGLIRLLAPD